MDEDDMVVVIVGDGDTENSKNFPMPKTEKKYDEVVKLMQAARQHGQLLSVKEESITDDEFLVGVSTFLEDHVKLMEAAREHGHPLSVKEESITDDEFLEDNNDEEDAKKIIETAETHVQYVKIGSCDDSEGLVSDIKEEYVTDVEQGFQDDDYYDQDYVPEDGEESKSDSDNEVSKNRRTFVTPAQRKSFVYDLKMEYPELRYDKEALVKTLAEIMRNIKRPPPPRDFFIITDIMFECRKCGSMSESIQAAGRHYQERHGQRYLVCFACGVDFRSTTNLYKHEKRCSAPDISTVLKARALFLGRKGRSRPFIPKPEDILERETIQKIKRFANFVKQIKVRNKHESRFACSACPASFTTKQNLEAHENLHKGLRPYRCPKCFSAYTSSPRLQRHMRQQHSGIEFICDHCGRGFKVKGALAVHLNTHMPVPKFGCESCPRRYATKAALKQHVRRAHQLLPPPCGCPICPKSYPRMSLVRDHMKKAHGMSLMTRMMFYKALPKLTDAQLQEAKAILASDGPALLN